MTPVIMLRGHGFQRNKIYDNYITLEDIDDIYRHTYPCFTENMT